MKNKSNITAFFTIVIALSLGVVLFESPKTMPKQDKENHPVYVLPKVESMERVANPLQF